MKDMANNLHIDIVFDGPPDVDGGRLVEIDDASGQSVALRTWFQRADGHWVLRITPSQIANPPRVPTEDV
jgi:hypothetical protein